MRHQTAITVCDENEVVSVKLSPNDVTGYLDRPTKRCQSEHASPNVFEDRNFLYDEKVINTNRSTGCLVYVPSDPWLRMSDEDVVTIQSCAQNKKKKKKNRSGAISADARTSSSSSTKFVFPAVPKSRSKPNILDYDDPWVWQGEIPSSQQPARRTDPRKEVSTNREQKGLSRQTKSLQSKQPTEMEWYSPPLDANSTSDLRAKGHSNQAMDFLEGVKVSSSGNVFKSLQVTMNLQPRHSFSSTPSQRDQELNIRRLSEQTRHTSRSPMGSTSAGVNRGNWLETSGCAGLEYDPTCTWVNRETMSGGRTSDDLTSTEDPLLETTC